jgi:hypothetical protein
VKDPILTLAVLGAIVTAVNPDVRANDPAPDETESEYLRGIEDEVFW